MAVFVDLYGNKWDLVQAPGSRASMQHPRMTDLRIVLVSTLLLACTAATALPAQADPDSSSRLPVQRVTRVSVIAFWRVPASDSVLEADPDLASALDDQQYYWANTRPLLEADGISALDQPGRVFVVHEPGRRWRFAAPEDSAAVGFLLVAPGRVPQTLYGRQFPDELLAAARAFARTAAVRR